MGGWGRDVRESEDDVQRAPTARDRPLLCWVCEGLVEHGCVHGDVPVRVDGGIYFEVIDDSGTTTWVVMADH